jgi:hypothetical protein
MIISMGMPFFAVTFDGIRVECVEWDTDSEQWAGHERRRYAHHEQVPDIEYRRYAPEALLSCELPFLSEGRWCIDPEECRPGIPLYHAHYSVPLDVPMEALTLEGTPVRVVGGDAATYGLEWLTAAGEHHRLVNFPRPLLPGTLAHLCGRHRSIDAPWCG